MVVAIMRALALGAPIVAATTSAPTGAPTIEYEMHADKNAYSDCGAVNYDSDDTSQVLSEGTCQSWCTSTSGCECIAYRIEDGMCWRRSSCIPASFCNGNGQFHTWVRKG